MLAIVGGFTFWTAAAALLGRTDTSTRTRAPVTAPADPFLAAVETYQDEQFTTVEQCCSSLAVTLGGDGSPIVDAQIQDFAVLLIALGFDAPAVGARMDRTRALDGTQQAEGTHARAYWTYHPDDGLQIVFERI